ncbi:hypothetical protein [Spirosoma terrae]
MIAHNYRLADMNQFEKIRLWVNLKKAPGSLPGFVLAFGAMTYNSSRSRARPAKAVAGVVGFSRIPNLSLDGVNGQLNQSAW